MHLCGAMSNKHTAFNKKTHKLYGLTTHAYWEKLHNTCMTKLKLDYPSMYMYLQDDRAAYEQTTDFFVRNVLTPFTHRDSSLVMKPEKVQLIQPPMTIIGKTLVSVPLSISIA